MEAAPAAPAAVSRQAGLPELRSGVRKSGEGGGVSVAVIHVCGGPLNECPVHSELLRMRARSCACHRAYDGWDPVFGQKMIPGAALQAASCKLRGGVHPWQQHGDLASRARVTAAHVAEDTSHFAEDTAHVEEDAAQAEEDAARIEEDAACIARTSHSPLRGRDTGPYDLPGICRHAPVQDGLSFECVPLVTCGCRGQRRRRLRVGQGWH